MRTTPPFLFTTQRLGFRFWCNTDTEPFAAINSDPDVMEFFPTTLNTDESIAFIQRVQQHCAEYNYGFYAVELLESREFIGFIGFSHPRFTSFFTPCVEIGWRLAKQHWGMGLATEGARACIEYGHTVLGMRTIYSFTATTNKRSERVMKKIGMQKVGEFDHPMLPDTSPLQRHVLYHIAPPME